jgi:virginiamycin B lyase
LEALESRRLLTILNDSFALPSAGTAGNTPVGITTGPNNTVWFTDTTSNQVAMLNTTTGTLGTPIAVTAEPEGIVYVPGGNLVFTEYDPTTQTGYIGQINPNTGQFLGSVQTPTQNSAPVGITYDPSNSNVYFAEKAAGKIGWFKPSNPSSMQENALPNASSAAPSGITYDPIDDDLWFTEEGADQIGSFDPSKDTFNSTPFTLPNGTLPSAITLGSDGNLWFTESGVGLINMFNPSNGTFAANGPYALPASSGNAGAVIQGITTGTDGDI